MIMILETVSIFVAASILNMKNPVKMGMAVLVLGASSLAISSKISGEMWVNVILFLLFMGGIMVVFMVISSLAPNENPKKMSKVSFVLALSACIVIIWGGMSEGKFSTAAQIKTSMMSVWFMSSLVILMSIYFFLFMVILNKSNMSLRTFA